MGECMQRGGRPSVPMPLPPGGTLAVLTPVKEVGGAPRRPPPAPPRAGNGPSGSLADPSIYQLGAPFLKPGPSVGTGVSAKPSVAAHMVPNAAAVMAAKICCFMFSPDILLDCMPAHAND